MLSNKSIRIDKQFLWMLFLLIPYIKLPDYIVGYTINNFVDLWKIVSFSILFFTLIKENKFSKICILFLLFEFFMLISTLMTNDYSKMWTQFVQLLSVVGIVLFTDYFINKDCKKYFSVVSKYVCFLAFINSLTMFLYYPNGMYVDFRSDCNYYFLQLDNISFFTVYIGLISLIIYSLLRYGKISFGTYCYLLFIFSSFFYVDSTTAYTSILFLIFGCIVINFTNIKFNYFLCIIFISLFCLGITYFHVQDYFKYIIVDLLHKRLDFTSRRWIWDRTIEYIKNKPFIGYGLESGIIMQSKIGFNHIHNIFLEIIYKGGFISFIMYYIILIYSGLKISLVKNSKLYNLLCLFILLYLFICQFDYYNDIYIGFIIYLFVFNAPIILKTMKEVDLDE